MRVSVALFRAGGAVRETSLTRAAYAPLAEERKEYPRNIEQALIANGYFYATDKNCGFDVIAGRRTESGSSRARSLSSTWPAAPLFLSHSHTPTPDTGVVPGRGTFFLLFEY